MTNDDFPNGVSPEVAAAAARPLDETDAALLDELADVLTLAEPVPDDLVARVQFALALDEVYAEVAEITRVQHDALAVRSDPTAEMRTETLTFTAERVTAMVTVSRAGSDQLRLDGWLAPGAPARVVLRMQEGTQEVTADDAGRFAFDGVPEGFAQLTIALGPDPEDTVVTPLFQL
jgi:hypothetical protein